MLYKIQRENIRKQEEGNLDIIYLVEALFRTESVKRSTVLLHGHLMRNYWLDHHSALKFFLIK